jgi:hypothetical protein
MNTEEAKPEANRKSAAALVELLAICPICGLQGSALYESPARCCDLYLLTWFRSDAA